MKSSDRFRMSNIGEPDELSYPIPLSDEQQKQQYLNYIDKFYANPTIRMYGELREALLWAIESDYFGNEKLIWLTNFLESNKIAINVKINKTARIIEDEAWLIIEESNRLVLLEKLYHKPAVLNAKAIKKGISTSLPTDWLYELLLPQEVQEDLDSIVKVIELG